MTEYMPEEIWATPKGSGTLSGVYVDMPLGDEPRGEHKYIRADLVPQWQPIETAPKDGTDILVWWPFWSKSPEVAAFIDGEWYSECVTSDSTEKPPTHWMPLPAPPE